MNSKPSIWQKIKFALAMLVLFSFLGFQAWDNFPHERNEISYDLFMNPHESSRIEFTAKYNCSVKVNVTKTNGREYVLLLMNDEAHGLYNRDNLDQQTFDRIQFLINEQITGDAKALEAELISGIHFLYVSNNSDKPFDCHLTVSTYY